jgi:hypothetical protein
MPLRVENVRKSGQIHGSVTAGYSEGSTNARDQGGHWIRQPRTEKPEPRVGIFWFFDGKLILDATPISMAEAYGTALTHPTGHINYWTQLQHEGVVPAEIEYEEPPRGRAVYDQREQRFHLLADKCILNRRDVVGQIMDAMHLPPGKTTEGRDEHYRCFSCLYKVDDDGEF